MRQIITLALVLMLTLRSVMFCRLRRKRRLTGKPLNDVGQGPIVAEIDLLALTAEPLPRHRARRRNPRARLLDLQLNGGQWVSSRCPRMSELRVSAEFFLRMMFSALVEC